MLFRSFRRSLGLFQAGPGGFQSNDHDQIATGMTTGEAVFLGMLERSTARRAKLDRAYFFASKQMYEECARLLNELHQEIRSGGGRVNQDGGMGSTRGCDREGDNSDNYDPEVAFLLGQLLLFGVGVPQDYSRGFHLTLDAAQSGYAPAFFDCGFCYYQGWGTLPDSREAEHWLNESLSKCSNPQSAIILGQMWLENETTLYSLEKIIEIIAWAINTLNQNPYKSSWL